jgi:hypothetical protein
MDGFQYPLYFMKTGPDLYPWKIICLSGKYDNKFTLELTYKIFIFVRKGL